MKCARRVRLAPALRSSTAVLAVADSDISLSPDLGCCGDGRRDAITGAEKEGGTALAQQGLGAGLGGSPSEIHPVSSGANGACEVQCADLLIRESPQIQSLAQLNATLHARIA